MRTERITKGDIIRTEYGELEITGYDNGNVYCIERIIESEDRTMFKLHEIEHIMKAVDGRNHHIIYEEVEE